MSTALPSFDLVVATIDRDTELRRLLDSLAEQTYRAFRVLVVDQNADGRLDEALARDDLAIERIGSAPGLSRARNAALGHLAADVVAFPDDDCVYPAGLLRRVGERLAADPALDGITARIADRDGRSDAGWAARGAVLEKETAWNLVASAGLFLRRSTVERVGAFDERLGVGAGTPYACGEETDYVIRALAAGARIAYDPTLVVEHERAPRDRDGLRRRGQVEGASVGYLLRKHGFSIPTLARMLVRPIGGVGVSLARRDAATARFHAETLRGRIRGYFGARRSKSSA